MAINNQNEARVPIIEKTCQRLTNLEWATNFKMAQKGKLLKRLESSLEKKTSSLYQIAILLPLIPENVLSEYFTWLIFFKSSP